MSIENPLFHHGPVLGGRSALVSELMTFPAGTNDDQVDTLSLIGRVLPQLAGGRVPKDPEKVWREPTINELFEMQEREQEYAVPTRRRI